MRCRLLFLSSALVASMFLLSACSQSESAPTVTFLPTWTPEPPTAVPSPVATVAPATPTAAAPASTPAGSTNAATPDSAVLFRDDFSDPSSGWGAKRFPEGIVEYREGAYHINVARDNAGLQTSRPNEGSFTDVSLEADVTRAGGPADGLMGIGCRYNSTSGNGYFFTIDATGGYQLMKLKNRSFSTLAEYMVKNSPVRKGNTTNHVRADCVADRLTMWINGQQVYQWQDSDFGTGFLSLGAMTGSTNKGGVDALFQNFVARKAEVASPTPTPAPLAFGTVLTQDDFKDPSSGWPHSVSVGTSADYNPGGWYQMSGNAALASFEATRTPPHQYGDVSVRVTASVRSGSPDDSYGVACRFLDKDNHYRASLFVNGGFGIYKMNGGVRTQLSFHNASPAIKAGAKVDNAIRFDCVGNTLVLYVNGQKLDEVQDDDIPAGDVGLRVSSVAPGLLVYFATWEVRGP